MPSVNTVKTKQYYFKKNQTFTKRPEFTGIYHTTVSIKCSTAANSQMHPSQVSKNNLRFDLQKMQLIV